MSKSKSRSRRRSHPSLGGLLGGAVPWFAHALYVAEVVLGDLHRRAREFGRGPDWDGRTLQLTHGLVRRSGGWGFFMAYQAVVDMRFSRELLQHAPDRASWAAAGPGTIRGLNRL